MHDEWESSEEGNRRIEFEVIEPLSFDEALSIIGEKTRARIIVELGKSKTTDPNSPNRLAFSELMNQVGIDDSGRLNYHLDKLVGTFVKKHERGYSLRLPGQLIYEAVVGGTLTDRQSIEPFTVGQCPKCDNQLTAAYHPDHLLTVECTSCETLYDAIHFPARGIGHRSDREILDAAFQRRHHKVAMMQRGVCHSCGGVIARALQPSATVTYGSGSVEDMAGLETYAVLACESCNTSLVGHPANVALSTPIVTGFFAEHDLDIALTRWWDPSIVTARDGIEVLCEDPRSVALPFTIEDDQLRVVIDDNLQVIEWERNRT